MKVVSKKDNTGKVVYNSSIVQSVIECALDEIDGVVKYDPTNKTQKQAKNYIRVDYVDDYLYVEVFVRLNYAATIPEVASKVQSNIKNSIESMTEFKVKDINVHIVDVAFEEKPS